MRPLPGRVRDEVVQLYGVNRLTIIANKKNARGGI